MSQTFVNLHSHSFYSILQSMMSPTDILNKAKSLDCPAVAITDNGVGYGLIDFYKNAQKLGDIKPILGVEIAIAKDSRFEKRPGIDGDEGYLVLLAKNHKGYENLLKLISIAQLEGLFNQPRIDWELLAENHEGLLCLSGGAKGLLGKELHNNNPERAKDYLDKCIEIFGKDDFILECVAKPGEAQKNINIWNTEQAAGKGLSVVVTSDARFANIEDEEAADTLHCIGKNHTLSDPHREKIMHQGHFKSWAEMCQTLDYIDAEILETAREKSIDIADDIDLELKFNQSLLPHFDVEEGESESSQLEKNCQAGFVRRGFDKSLLPEQIKEYQDRLAYELMIIGKMGFDAYFLIVEDFMQFAKESGIAVGPGRGSAAGSLVSYLLEITNIDPIEYDLLFERFLNPERISMPDIDIDFSDERRDEVMTYVVEKYGIEKVSKVCTFGTLAAKAALKDVGRAQGVDFSEMNAMTKIMPNTPGFKLKDAEELSDFKDLLKAKPHLNKVLTISKKLEGCVRHVSVHACAVIIGADDLSKFCPIQWAPGAEELKITQFPYEQLESIGLLKMDFLGLRNLSILEKTINNIRHSTGEEVDLNTIPIQDEKTFKTTFAAGETTGVFQFESAGMRRYLKELKPTEFEDLVAMNALYRPGPMEYIPQYIEGKHDPTKVKYMHPALEAILNTTYGIAVYQEQVLRIARDFSGFSLGEADILRKAIGKKIASILTEQRQKIIDGAFNKGFDKKTAAKIFDEIIVPFSGYGFNRSHAVCYARIAYETAYLRANYPVEFMAAMMTTDRNNTDRIVLEMNECQSMNIDVLPPSINDSGSYFTVITEDKKQMVIG